jgi:hypothetical protein
MSAVKAAKCPVTRAGFAATAKPVVVEVAGQKLLVQPKMFSTGSLGWYYNGKVVIDVDGTPCQVQVGLNLTIVGSKDAG